MLGLVCFALIISLAFAVRSRLLIAGELNGLVRFAASLAVIQYFTAWMAFAIYLVLGMGTPALTVLTFFLLAMNIGFWPAPKFSPGGLPSGRWRATVLFSFVVLFCLPFFTGISTGKEGAVFCRFNLLDTAFHLGIARSFLANPRFPPMDLEMAGHPMNYHFMADFFLAFLFGDRLNLIRSMQFLNVVQSMIVALVLWGVVERWLSDPPPLVTGAACAMFSFLPPFVENYVVYRFLPPDVFANRDLPWFLFSYQYCNFEYMTLNLLQPQRALLFSFPIILLVLHGLCVLWRRFDAGRAQETAWLLALLPFAHATSFLVLGACVVPVAVKHRREAGRVLKMLLLPLGIAIVQLVYLKWVLPVSTPGYSGWDAINSIPFHDFNEVPGMLQRAAFWLVADGQFLVLGALGLWLAWRLRSREGNRGFFEYPVLPLLGVFVAYFLLINYYRFSRNWGDSNKFVMFLNLWLSVILAKQMAVMISDGRRIGKILLLGVLGLSLGPYAWRTYQGISCSPYPMFSKAELEAATWIRTHATAEDILLTTPLSGVHFVSALAGRQVLHGMYATTFPYFDPELTDKIRALYENADLQVLLRHPVRFIVVSNHERWTYHLNPLFEQPGALVFSNVSPDREGVRIYDARALLDIADRARAGVTGTPVAAPR